MRILVAEDEAISRTFLKRALERLGHEVIATSDGEQAWQTLSTGEFEMVVSDWMMPGLDGLEFCRRVREQAAEGDGYTYFVLLTALDSKESFSQGMEAGADDYFTKPLDPDQLKAKLIAATRIMNLHRRLAAQNTQLEDLNRKLFEEGRVDSLTRVGNRLRMTEDLTAAFDRVKRYGHRYSAALGDVDFFKKYNDTCGHQAGDDVLRAVGGCLQAQTRLGDAVYRYGGEEFLILLPEQTPDKAMVAMERMRKAIEELDIAHPGKDPAGVVTMSFGIGYVGPEAAEKDMETWLKEADDALYRAKQTGRNRVVYHGDPE